MRKLALGVAALCLAACGEVVPLDTDASIDAQGDAQEIDAVTDPCAAASLDPAAFGSCFARTVCEVYSDCTGSDLSHIDCEDLSFEILGGLSPTQLEVVVASAMTANRVTWNGTAAKTCLDMIATGGCSIFKNGSDPLEACGIVTGHVATGAICQNDIECQQAGARCEQTTGGGANPCVDFTCKAPATTAALCTNGAFCGLGDHCVPKNSAAGANISFCGTGVMGAMCDSDRDCDRNLFCMGGLGNASASGTCAPSKAAGASCRTDEECTGELACVGNFGSATGVCRDVRQPNAVCDNNNFIAACYGHQVCENPGRDMTGMCHASPNLGGTCAQRDGMTNWCGLFLACDMNVCHEPGAIGDPCTVSSGDISNNPMACNSGLFCDKDLSTPPATSGVCRARQNDGASCTEDDQCASDHCGGTAPNQTCSTYPVCAF